jgi:ATP-binding cassette subfamily B multidrug efflux pump
MAAMPQARTGFPPDATVPRLIWSYLRRHAGPFLVGAVFLLATQYLTLEIPGELGAAIQALDDADEGTLALEAARAVAVASGKLIVLLAVAAAATRILSRVLIFNAARRIEYDLRNEVFTHLATLSPAYYQRVPTGDLTSRVINDTTYVRLMYGLAVLHLANTAFAYVMTLGKMVQIDLVLTALCVAPYPPLLWAVQRLANQLHSQTRVVQERLADLSAQVQEDLSGIAVVKTYAVEELEAQRFDATCEQYVQENLRLARIRGLLMPLMVSIGALGGLTVLYFGGRAVITEQGIELGEFVEFSGYLGLLSWPTIALGWIIAAWNRGTAAFERLAEVMREPADVVAPDPEETDRAVVAGDIELRGVRFRYPGADHDALHDLDLHIRAGTRVGIVGRSGSGKSTLVNLIPRLYDVSGGEVLIDGTPIGDIPLSRLRGAIGYAPQEPFLFSTTVASNIALGVAGVAGGEGASPGALDSEGSGAAGLSVEEAVAMAQLERDLDAFPQGLDTMVGERGITLSGGQKQRVALARALMTQPRILILDDSLSSVDTETERRILDHMESAMGQRTAIVVTHRFSILELLDEIVVMAGGTVVERGSHRELIAAGGHYAAMVARQALREEISSL